MEEETKWVIGIQRHFNGTYVRVKKGSNYLKMNDLPGQLLKEGEVKLSEDLLKETAILHKSHINMPYLHNVSF